MRCSKIVIIDDRDTLYKDEDFNIDFREKVRSTEFVKDDAQLILLYKDEEDERGFTKIIPYNETDDEWSNEEGILTRLKDIGLNSKDDVDSATLVFCDFELPGFRDLKEPEYKDKFKRVMTELNNRLGCNNIILFIMYSSVGSDGARCYFNEILDHARTLDRFIMISKLLVFGHFDVEENIYDLDAFLIEANDEIMNFLGNNQNEKWKE